MIFPSLNLSKEECNGALRRLELETYSNLISVFRAQGCLNNEKYKILTEMRKLLFINEERHRAEARRAANDEYLTTIANVVYGPNSELQWLKEGRRLFPLLNRKAPLSSLTNVANSAAKYPFTKKTQEFPKRTEDKKLNEEKLNENVLKFQPNISTSNIYREIQASEKSNAFKDSDTLNNTINAQSTNESKLDHFKNEKVESSSEIKSEVVLNRYDDKVEQSNNTALLEKGKFIVVNNEISKPNIGNVNLVGNILNIKRKPPEKSSESTDVPQNKYIKTEIVKDAAEVKCVTIPTVENLVGQTKGNSNQSAVAVQKIINPFMIENVKVPANAIQIKDIQNRKAVKLITTPNGKIFIQPAQGSSNRIANIRPLTTVIKPNQCIALKKVTSLGPVTDIQSKPLKISKANMIILPKTSLNQKQPEIENVELVTKSSNLPKFSIQSVTTPSLSNAVSKTTSDQQNQVGNQGNVFVIGSVINQSIISSDKNNDRYDENTDNDNAKDLITEDTPVDIIQMPIEEIYKTDAVNIIETTAVDNRIPEIINISDSTRVINNDQQQNINVYSTTDWELELDQEAAQRNKDRSNSEEDNFNSVIEEIIEEATEDSFSEYEESCQYDEISGL